MTSNIGSRQLKDFGQGVGFATTAKQAASSDHAKSVIENALKKAFAPEFLNRIDDVVIFDSLEREDIHKIIDIELSHLYDRIHSMGLKIIVTPEAKDFIVEKGWDAQFGARPLKRAIQKYIEDPLAEEIIKTKLTSDDIINIDISGETKEIIISIVKEETEAVQNL
jgi:ATP-dependent Clp protease ATP-binding subunit ClpC